MAEGRCPACFSELSGAGCGCGYHGNANHQLPMGTMLRKRYQVGKVLGQGGYGITYLCWDTLLQRRVAVKEFFPEGTVYRRSDVSTNVECVTDRVVPHFEYTRERFLREASALVKFQDIPEVVCIHDFVEENNTAYIVMEYVRGVDLAKYIRMKGGKLTPEETFRILKPVMEALAKIHKGGIVHRDISPDNIILDPMGGAKLLDFGAVRAVEDPDVDKGLNKSTEAILKRGFAPIEQYNTRGSLGPWTDEYAMCATVWYCLTGSIPEEASIRVSEGIDPDWSSIEGLPEHQQKALEKGFSCRAKDRYESMDGLLADLFPEGETPVSILGETEAVPAREATTPKKRGKQFWTIAATAVLVIILAVAVLLPKEAKTGPTEPLSPEEEAYLQAEALLEEGKLGEAAIAFGKLSGFSDARERSFTIWEQITVRDTVEAGDHHTVGLRADGTVIATGSNDFGQCGVKGWTDVVAIAASQNHTVGLRANGIVMAVGANYFGQCDVKGWTDVVAIATRDGFFIDGTSCAHTVGLRSDGTVVATGSNDCGQCSVGDWTNVVAIAAGLGHTVGLRADGTVVATGRNNEGQCDTSSWTNVVAIDAGYYHTVGLRADGTVVAVGSNGFGQCDVEDWTDVVAIAAGWDHTVGLRADGTVVAVGANYFDQCAVQDWTNVVAIAANQNHTVGLRADGTVVAAGIDLTGQCDVENWTDVVAISAGYCHTVGLRADGTVVAVGIENQGQCDVSGWTDIRMPRKKVPFR